MEMTGGGRISPTGGKTGHTHYAPDLPGASDIIPNIDGGSPSAIYGDITEVNGGGV